MKSLIVLSLFVLSSLGLSSMAQAASLSGHYRLDSQCEVAGARGEYTLEPGAYTVMEHVPVRDTTGTVYEAVIFQYADRIDPVVTLSIGKYMPFAYGFMDFSVGTYGAGNFQEVYNHQASETLVEVTATLTTTPTKSGLKMKSIDYVASKQTTCEFVRRP